MTTGPMKIGGAMPLQVPPSERQDKVDTQLRAASKMYEKHFLREMVKAMRQTVHEDGIMKPNFGQKLYQEQLDGEYVEMWGEAGGVGLSQLIYQQIKERFFPQKSETPVGVPQGPMQLRKPPINIQQDPQRTFMNLPKVDQSGAQFEFRGSSSGFDVVSPWSGKLISSFKDEQGRQVVRLGHAGQLVSTLIYRGEGPDQTMGSEIAAGQRLGQVPDSSRELVWQVKGPGGVTPTNLAGPVSI